MWLKVCGGAGGYVQGAGCYVQGAGCYLSRVWQNIASVTLRSFPDLG